jgi:acetyl-CoA carboxylase biotin carboxyl carrier protein
MNFDEIKQLLDMVREHELSEFELEREGFKIRIRKNGSSAVSYQPSAPSTAAPIAASHGAPAPIGEGSVPDADEPLEIAVVKSPIVGTFYRSPDPSAAPFVNVGDTVKKDQVLCIIEAMKLMNEINSEIDGVIANIYVENGQPVQYGERLFAIRPR